MTNAQRPSEISVLCDCLADAFEAKGVAVRKNLRPGLTREGILRIVQPLKLVLPEDVIALYQWRNGHDDESAENVLCFRDNTFLSLERAVEEFASVQSTYGADSTLQNDWVDLRACIPFSHFEGAWDVVACGAHLHRNAGDHPVIRVFQGVDLYYPSIGSMLKTCIEWVSHAQWDPMNGLPDSVVMAIWRKHAPGIFDAH